MRSGDLKETVAMAMLLLVVCVGAQAQQKQTMRAYFEDLNAKAAAGQPLPPFDQELFMGTGTVPLAEIVDAAPAIRVALAHDATVKYGAGMLVGFALRPDTDAVLRASRLAMEGVLAKGSLDSRGGKILWGYGLWNGVREIWPSPRGKKVAKSGGWFPVPG